jgi:acetyl esterase
MTTPDFDADIANWQRERSQDPTAAEQSIAGARRHSLAVNARARALREDAPRPARTSELPARVTDSSGADRLVPARLFQPAGTGPTATVVYFHGGGWVFGDMDTHTQHVERLCVEAGVNVVSVDYRRAPEHSFPAAFDDCLAVTRWVAGQQAELGGDGRLVVAGDSAGAQIAASVAIACRSDGPALSAQLLIAPVTDTAGCYADPELNSRYPSRIERGTGFGLTTAGMAAFCGYYGLDPLAPDWRASPMQADDHSGLPAAVVHVGGFDPLRDEVIAYAQTLERAGVPVRLRVWPTLNHGYFALGGVSRQADLAAACASQDLVEILLR